MHRNTARRSLKSRFSLRMIVVALFALAGIGAASYAYAATTVTPRPPVGRDANNLTHVKIAKGGAVSVNGTLDDTQCPAGSYCTTWNTAGGSGGAVGPQGPSGVIKVSTTTFDPIASIPEGGSFNAKATEVGTVTLDAGTYLVNLNMKVKGSATATSGDVFPQFFVYNQPKNANFDGNLFNIGAGAIEVGSTNHDSYFSGSSIITLTATTTLRVYGFGYQSDSGAGDYVDEGGTFDAIKVTPAS